MATALSLLARPALSPVVAWLLVPLPFRVLDS